MAGVVRVGDVNSAGGVVIGPGATSVLVNGRPAITTGSMVLPHPCCGSPHCPPMHCMATTTIGSMTVLAEGKPIVYKGSPDTCFDSRVTGSDDVLVGN
jgi:uncharacterized Zn-binding protein involved in type VI secretion